MAAIASWTEVNGRLRDPRFLGRLVLATVAGHLTAAFVLSILTMALDPYGTRGYAPSVEHFVGSVALFFEITAFFMVPLTAAMLPVIVLVAYGLKLGQFGSVALGAVFGHIMSLLRPYIMLRHLGHAVGFPNPLHINLADLPPIVAGMSFGWLLWFISFRSLKRRVEISSSSKLPPS